MQTERKVFEKLFTPEKVELELQKIELALTDDVKSADKYLTASYDEINKVKNSLLDGFRAYKGSIARALDTAHVLYGLSAKLADKSKEFGLEIPQDYINIQKNAQAKQKELQSLFDSVNKAMSII